MSVLNPAYCLCRQASHPTGADFVQRANITGPNDTNLLVANRNVLRIYLLLDEGWNGTQSSDREALRLIEQFELPGVIEDMGAMPLPNRDRDVLFLTFREAKLSVVEFDPIACTLQTLACYSFEDERLKLGRFSAPLDGSPVHCKLLMDPKQRCVSVLWYGEFLSVLPLNSRWATGAPPLVMSQSEIDDAMQLVKDLPGNESPEENLSLSSRSFQAPFDFDASEGYPSVEYGAAPKRIHKTQLFPTLKHHALGHHQAKLPGPKETSPTDPSKANPADLLKGGAAGTGSGVTFIASDAPGGQTMLAQSLKTQIPRMQNHGLVERFGGSDAAWSLPAEPRLLVLRALGGKSEWFLKRLRMGAVPATEMEQRVGGADALHWQLSSRGIGLEQRIMGGTEIHGSPALRGVPTLDPPALTWSDDTASDGQAPAPWFSGGLIRNVRSAVMLEGYQDATIALLHQAHPTAPGTHATRPAFANCGAITAISLDSAQTYPVVWSADHLPADCTHILAVPPPLCGALLISPNAVLYLSQTERKAMTFNCYSEPPSTEMRRAIELQQQEQPLQCSVMFLEQEETINRKKKRIFPLVDFETEESPYVMSLEASRHCWVSPDTLLLGTKDGHLHTLRLVTAEGSHRLQSFQLTSCGQSVQPSCLTALSPQHTFIGSRLGDSVLLRHTPLLVRDSQEQEQGSRAPGNLEVCDSIEGVGPVIDSACAIHVGETQTEPTRELLAGCGSEKSGALALLSQCVHTDIGATFPLGGFTKLWALENASELSPTPTPEDTDTQDTGKKAIQGEDGMTVEMEGCVGVGVGGDAEEKKATGIETAGEGETEMNEVSVAEQMAKHLILSKNERTLILSPGGEGQQLCEVTRRTQWAAQEAAIACGSVDSGRLTVQVCPAHIRILKQGRLIHRHPLTHAVLDAQICDPYITLLIHHNNNNNNNTTDTHTPPETQSTVDIPQLACLAIAVHVHHGPDSEIQVQLAEEKFLWDEDRIESFCVMPPCEGVRAPGWDELSYLLITGHHSGSLLIHTLPAQPTPTPTHPHTPTPTHTHEPMCYLHCSDLPNLMRASPVKIIPEKPASKLFLPVDAHPVRLLLTDRLPGTFGVPCLLVLLSTGEFAIYLACPDAPLRFRRIQATAGGSLLRVSIPKDDDRPVPAPQARVRRRKHARDKKHAKREDGRGKRRRKHHHRKSEPSSQPTAPDTHNTPTPTHTDTPQPTPTPTHPHTHPDTQPTTHRHKRHHKKHRHAKPIVPYHGPSHHPLYPRFCPFENIGGKSGVFVTGESPFWVFWIRGYAHCHWADTQTGAVSAFAPFQHESCGQGYAMLNVEGSLLIGSLPPGACYEHGWVMRKAPLERTVHRVAYHPDYALYVCAVSHSVSVDMGPQPSSRVPQLYDDQFELLLISAETWETVARFEMNPSEHVLDLVVVPMRSDYTHYRKRGGSEESGAAAANAAYDDETMLTMKHLIAVGTGFAGGEDLNARGRILLFDISLGEDNTPSFNKLYEKEQKCPTTALAPLDGYLVAGVGQRMIVYRWDRNEQLNGMAFIDMQFYTVSISCARSLVLYADIHKSLHFVVWRPDQRALTLVAQDDDHLRLLSSQFLVRGANVSMVATDDKANVRLFSFDPNVYEARGGGSLVPVADFHLGTRIHRLIRARMPCETVPTYALVFGTLDGGLGTLAPLPERAFRRIRMLEQVLVANTDQLAGLNPVEFRTYKSPDRRFHSYSHNVVDGDIVRQYMFLPRSRQQRLARRIGENAQAILTFLQSLDRTLHIFA